MRRLLSLFRKPAPTIVLTGHLLAPKPGQILVLQCRTPVDPDHRHVLMQVLRERFGSTQGLLVIDGDASLSVEDRQECGDDAKDSNNEG